MLSLPGLAQVKIVRRGGCKVGFASTSHLGKWVAHDPSEGEAMVRWELYSVVISRQMVIRHISRLEWFTQYQNS